MKKLKRYFAPAAALAAMALPSAAFAGQMHLSLVGALDDENPSASGITNPAYSSKLGFGGGALLGFGLGYRTELEVGALYIQRSWKETNSGSVFDTSAPAFEVPVVLRYWLLRNLSIGVGGYFAEGLGQITQTAEVGGASTSVGYSAYDGQGMDRIDYGLVGSVGIRLPVARRFSIVLDGRYLYGLNNVVTNLPAGSTASLKFRDFQGLAGFCFGL